MANEISELQEIKAQFQGLLEEPVKEEKEKIEEETQPSEEKAEKVEEKKNEVNFKRMEEFIRWAETVSGGELVVEVVNSVLDGLTKYWEYYGGPGIEEASAEVRKALIGSVICKMVSGDMMKNLVSEALEVDELAEKEE
jgi:hypothetical protein